MLALLTSAVNKAFKVLLNGINAHYKEEIESEIAEVKSVTSCWKIVTSDWEF